MKVSVETTYLEMTDPAQSTPFEGERRLDLRRAEHPSPDLNRFFYVAVGNEWSWYGRRDWSKERWLAYLDRAELETWVGYLAGTPVGYFELESQGGGSVEIQYFGLLPDFVGRGLGRELLFRAVDIAWRPDTKRVWLHTCTLDHPRALRNYQAQGFEIYETKEEIEELPDAPLEWFPRESRLR